MGSIQIRRLTVEDATLLQQIGRTTFEQTFSSSNSRESMEKYLEDGFSLGPCLSKKEIRSWTYRHWFSEVVMNENCAVAH